jgi:multidrug resistance efflux pump
MAKVSKGQKVEITINAFPKEEYKIFEGTLSYISSDSIEGFYRAEVFIGYKNCEC